MTIFDHLFAARTIEGRAPDPRTEGAASREAATGSPDRAPRHRQWRAETEDTVFDAYRRWGIR